MRRGIKQLGLKRRLAGWLLALAGITRLCGGCGMTVPADPKLPSRYPDEGPKVNVPDFMRGTIWERVELGNTDPFPVSGYGLVVNLHNTADNSEIPALIRDYMIKQMVEHGFGMVRYGEEDAPPDDILRDRRVAVVQVNGFLPVGARKGQRFDVQVTTPRGSNTSSLAHGDLYRTELRYRGAEAPSAGAALLAWAEEGQVFVNPAYALSSTHLKASLRNGVVQNSGRVEQNRPIFLQLRQPQMSTSRLIEMRIRERFEDFHVDKVAAAEDEGIVSLFVPDEYNGDWRHFVGVATHLYLNPTPEFAAMQAQKLVEAAERPDAPLQDISYCWEALGPAAVPIYAKLMTSPQPDVAFAASRAAAFVGDLAAQESLMDIAYAQGHPFQLSAVQTLGQLPTSPAIDQKLRGLLGNDQTLVRLEAYRILADHHDPRIMTTVINNKFVLDVVQSDGQPLVYAARQGLPRIAVFGQNISINRPVTFTAMDNRLMISSAEGTDQITIFYRGAELKTPIKVFSSRNLPVLIARLGGQGAEDEARFSFSYGDIVAVLQAMVDQRQLTGEMNGAVATTAFVLQDVSAARDSIYTAPVITEGGRPQSDPRPTTSPTAAANP